MLLILIMQCVKHLHPDNLIAKIHKHADTAKKNILMAHLNKTNYIENRLQNKI